MGKYAPIVLFVYNRPAHTRRTMEALVNADLANESELIVYADGAADETKETLVKEVRALLREHWTFKRITIIERDRNWGLAANIIDGVTDVVGRYGRVIVLEDDLEISKVGLRYFNAALDHFEQEEKVMSISGYMYPVRQAELLPETFFFRVVNSWGWATWGRAWRHFNPDIDQLIAGFSKEDIREFSVGHSENFWKQVGEFQQGKINSWAIRWYLSVFKNRGLTLYPRQSMIQNIGTDGSGTHSDEDKAYEVRLAQEFRGHYPDQIREDKQAYTAIRYFFQHRKGSLLSRVIRYSKKKWKGR